MERRTKEWIEDNYGKIFLTAVTVIFAVILILGIRGFFGDIENTGKQKINQQVANSSR